MDIGLINAALNHTHEKIRDMDGRDVVIYLDFLTIKEDNKYQTFQNLVVGRCVSGFSMAENEVYTCVSVYLSDSTTEYRCLPKDAGFKQVIDALHGCLKSVNVEFNPARLRITEDNFEEFLAKSKEYKSRRTVTFKICQEADDENEMVEILRHDAKKLRA